MIAVTGANGLLGSFIIRKLIAHDRTFVALKRSGSDLSLLHDVAGKVTWRDCNVSDPVSVHEALQDVTHVIHTAAIVSFNPRHKQKILDINVAGTRNVVDACLNNDVKRLVHVSSVAALGRQRGQTLIDESSKWVDSNLNSVYAESKYLAELEVFRGQEEGLSTVMVNPSVILAPADWEKSSAQLFKYVWKERPFYIEGNLNYVDVRDVAEIIYRLLDAKVESERFIASAGRLSYHEFFSQAAAQLNKKVPGIKLNGRFLRVVASLEAIRTRITGSAPLITKETAKMAGTHFEYSSGKIKKLLNFQFQSLENSLQWCCNYYMGKMNGKN